MRVVSAGRKGGEYQEQPRARVAGVVEPVHPTLCVCERVRVCVREYVVDGIC